MATDHRIDEFSYAILESTDHTLDDVENLCSLDNDGLRSHSPNYSLGTLEQLPLEIISIVLVQLELQSLTDFRRVNRRARQVVDSIPQYRKIMAHAPASIRGSLSIGAGNSFSCQKLYEKLCTTECESCGDFGGYLYLVTCRRVCFLCFTEKTEYLPLLRTDVIRKFGLRHKNILDLPHMKSVPGFYTPRELKCRTRETGIAVHGNARAMDRYTSEQKSQKQAKHQSRKLLHKRHGTNMRPPRFEDAFDGRSSNPKRFMGIIRAPFLDPRTGYPEWGFHCTACRSHHYNRPFHWRRMFTRESFEDHIRECGEIIQGKHKRHVN